MVYLNFQRARSRIYYMCTRFAISFWDLVPDSLSKSHLFFVFAHQRLRRYKFQSRPDWENERFCAAGTIFFFPTDASSVSGSKDALARKSLKMSKARERESSVRGREIKKPRVVLIQRPPDFWQIGRRRALSLLPSTDRITPGATSRKFLAPLIRSIARRRQKERGTRENEWARNRKSFWALAGLPRIFFLFWYSHVFETIKFFISLPDKFTGFSVVGFESIKVCETRRNFVPFWILMKKVMFDKI